MNGLPQLWVATGEMKRICDSVTEDVFGRFAETFGAELPDA